MSGKASLLVAVFTAIAGIAILVALNTLNPTQQTAAILDTSSLQRAPSGTDTDHDGLPDTQEATWRTSTTNPDSDGDGFLDGEEVASGHDPRTKGPNDAFIKPLNLTQKAASLVAGGLLSGDLNKESATYAQSLDNLSDALTKAFRENSTTTEDTLTTVADTPQAHQAYITTMAWKLKTTLAVAIDDGVEFLYSLNDVPLSNLSVLTADTARYTKYQARITELSRQSGMFAAQLASVPVPVRIRTQHANLVRSLRILERQYQIASTLKSDPIQGSLAIHALVAMHSQEIPKVILSFSDSLGTLTTP
jgi:hypothetical protein